MSKESDLRRVLDGGIVAVVRSPDSQQLVEVTRALADGGVTTVEITLTVPDAPDVRKAGACCLGVGSQLVEPKAVAERNFDRIRDLARQYVAIVNEFRRAQKK